MFTGCEGTKLDSSSETSHESFEKELVKLQSFFHIPGIAVLVKEGNQTIYENYLGYADLENQVPLDSSTLFPIASVSKTFASVLIFPVLAG